MGELTFKQWLAKVNEQVWPRVGCSARDLPDCPFQDWYEGGISPVIVAGCLIESERAVLKAWDALLS